MFSGTTNRSKPSGETSESADSGGVAYIAIISILIVVLFFAVVSILRVDILKIKKKIVLSNCYANAAVHLDEIYQFSLNY